MLSIHFMSVVQDCLRHFKVQSHVTDAACSVCILCRICQLSRMVELHAVGMPESFFGVFFKTKSQCLVTSRNYMATSRNHLLSESTWKILMIEGFLGWWNVVPSIIVRRKGVTLNLILQSFTFPYHKL